MQKHQKVISKKLKAYFLTAVMGTVSALPIVAQATDAPAEAVGNKVELTLAEMDPTNKTHIPKLEAARNKDDDFIDDDISVAQFHALENAYVNDQVQLQHLTDLGLKTSAQILGRSKDLNDNVDLVLECRDKIKTNPLVRSDSHKRQMVRECAKSKAEELYKVPSQMMVAHLDLKRNESELQTRIKQDKLVGNPSIETYHYLHRAMIDPSITLNDMLGRSMIAYDNDSDNMEENAGHVLACRDKSFAEQPDITPEKRTDAVRACTNALMTEYEEPNLTKFDHIVPSLHEDPERFEKLDLKRYYQLGEAKIYGEFNFSSHRKVMRAAYSPDIDLGALMAQTSERSEYSAGNAYLDENMAVFISVRDALFEEHGVPNIENEGEVRAFQKLVIDETIKEIRKLSEARIEDFEDIPTHKMHPDMHEKVLEKRISHDEMVENGVDPKEYLWLEKAMYDPEITLQTLLDKGLDKTSGQKSLTGHAELVITTRDAILATPEGQQMSKEELRTTIRNTVFPDIVKKHEQSVQEEREMIKIFGKIALGVVGVAGIGVGVRAGVGAMRRRREKNKSKARKLAN